MAKTKTLTVKKEKKDLMFAGATTLMTKPSNQKEATERKLIVLVARAVSINPLGVNILGSLPYTNNQGRKEKMEEYNSGARFEYKWVQMALDDEQKAICQARVLDKDGKALTDFVTGECSPATTKMSTLRGYQNHMAQTRAENRAFEAAFGVRFRKELYEGISRELKSGNTTEDLAEKALTAGSTSAEEAVDLERAKRSSQDGTYDKALNIVTQEKDLKALEGYKIKISESKKYSRDQKAQLLRFIDARIISLSGK